MTPSADSFFCWSALGLLAVTNIVEALGEGEVLNANIFGTATSQRLKSDYPPNGAHCNRSNQPSLPGGIMSGGAFADEFLAQSSWRADSHVSPEKRTQESKYTFSNAISVPVGNFSNKSSVCCR